MMPNTAIHLSRLLKFSKDGSTTLRPGDGERYAALNATPPRLHYQDVRTRLLLRDGLEYRFAT